MPRTSCGIRRRRILPISIGASQPRGSGSQKPVHQITLIGSSGSRGESRGPLRGITKTSRVAGSVCGVERAPSHYWIFVRRSAAIWVFSLCVDGVTHGAGLFRPVDLDFGLQSPSGIRGGARYAASSRMAGSQAITGSRSLPGYSRAHRDPRFRTPWRYAFHGRWASNRSNCGFCGIDMDFRISVPRLNVAHKTVRLGRKLSGGHSPNGKKLRWNLNELVRCG